MTPTECQHGSGFHDQFLASAPHPMTGKPDPAKIKVFLASYPDRQGHAVDRQLCDLVPVRQQHLQRPERLAFINANGAVALRWSMCQSSRSSRSAPWPRKCRTHRQGIRSLLRRRSGSTRTIYAPSALTTMPKQAKRQTMPSLPSTNVTLI